MRIKFKTCMSLVVKEENHNLPIPKKNTEAVDTKTTCTQKSPEIRFLINNQILKQ